MPYGFIAKLRPVLKAVCKPRATAKVAQYNRNRRVTIFAEHFFLAGCPKKMALR